MGRLEEKVAIVTGAGSGVGREHALLLASEGAKIIVNDLGDSADDTTAQIISEGGEALSVKANVAEWSTGDTLVDAAVSTFGDLHILINNAGILRDAMSFSMNEAQFDEVIAVHLKGHFVCARAAGEYWRAQAKSGDETQRRIIHTSSESGLFGGPAQANYASAKGGILTLSITLGRELTKYGVTTNVVAPRARTALTDYIQSMAAPENPDEFDVYDPANVSPFVVWLCTDEAQGINGQAFIVGGSGIWWMRNWSHQGSVKLDGEKFTLEVIDANRDALFGDGDTSLPKFEAPPFS
ncbi:MAG: short-chain dehydrogenase [Acidimicrobiaceae bacterium]|nr:short-chain dehydrogenase [Acidimicrobiaceae bacterium]|tara:strand:+ start:822 stop:1709 length:888 start_codon:yes stop_codon:yes gene_type:complete